MMAHERWAVAYAVVYHSLSLVSRREQTMATNRITKSDVYEKFRTLCHVAGKTPIEKMEAKDRGTSKIIGAWHLDYMGTGGYIIKEVDSDFNMKFPMGLHYRGAKEMLWTMDFAIGVLEAYKLDSRILAEERRLNDGN